MTLVSQLREANPLIAPAGLSERANADLRTILGTDDVPVPRSPRPGRARWRWLVLGLAAALVAGGITVGVTLPGRHTTALPAWAGPITATVVSGTISPVAYGVSMTFDFPLPEQIGRPGLHLVERIWINDPTRTWQNLPKSVTFTPRFVEGDVIGYVASDWPTADGFGLVIGGGTLCAGTRPAWPELGVPMIGIGLCRLDDPAAYTTPDPVSGGGMGGGTIVTVDIGYVTTDPAAAFALTSQYDLSADGVWTSLPPGAPDMRNPGRATDQPSLTLPGTTTVRPGTIMSTDVSGRTYTITVTEDLQCTITGDATFAHEAGFTLNADGTCSYIP